MSYTKALGHRIKMFRKINDMTQMDLAKALGMTSTGAISQIEMGNKGMKLENIFKAARLFGVPVSVFVDEHDWDKKDLELILKVIKVVKENSRKRRYLMLKKLVRDYVED